MAKIIAIQVEINGVKGSIKNVNDLNLAVKATNKAFNAADEGTAAYKRMQTQLGGLKQAQASVRAETRNAGREHVLAADKGKSSYRAMNAELVNARMRFKELSQAERSGKLGSSLLKNIQGLDRELKSIDKSIGSYQRNVGNYKQSLLSIGNLVTGGLLTGGIQQAGQAFIRVIKDMANIVKEFDQASADLASILGKSKKQISALTKDAKRLGATTAFTATQVLQLQTELAKLGFSESEILSSTEAIENFSIAVGTDAASAAALAGGTLRAFQIDAKDTARVASVLAVATTKSALDFQKLNDSLSTVGPIARLAGFSLERTTALLGVLSDNNVKASTSGVALRKIFFELSKQGITFEAAMNKIRKATDKTKAALDLFGDRAALSAVLLSENADAADKMEESITNSNEALRIMVEQRLDTVAGQLTLLRSAWEGFILSIEDGEGAISAAFKGVIEHLSNTLELLRRINEGDLGVIDFFKQFSAIGIITGDIGTLNEVLEELAERDAQIRANNNELIRQNEILAGQLRERGADLETISRITRLSIDELERLFKTVPLGDGANIKPLINSIDALNAKLKLLRKTQNAAAIGSAVFNQAKADIKRVSAIIKEALGKDQKIIQEAIVGSINFLAEKVKNVKDFIKSADPDALPVLLETLVGNEKDLAEALARIQRIRDVLKFGDVDVSGPVKPLALKKTEVLPRAESEKEKDRLKDLTEFEKQEMQKITDIFQRQIDARIAASERLRDARIEHEKEVKQNILLALDVIGNFANELFATFAKNNQREVDSIARRYDTEIALAEGNESKQKALILEREKALLAAERKAFDRQKANDTALALINGAVAVAKTFATLGYPAGIPAAIAVGAQVLLQVALIQGQTFSAAEGALIGAEPGEFAKGKSHPQGGIKIRAHGRSGTIEGGEFVDYDEHGNIGIINKRSSSMFRNELMGMAGKVYPGKSADMSAINSYNKYGKIFAQEGALIRPPTGAPAAGFQLEVTTKFSDEQLVTISNLIGDAVEAAMEKALPKGFKEAEAERIKQARLNKTLGL